MQLLKEEMSLRYISEYNENRVRRLFEGVEFEKTISVHENIDVTFYKNGHLIGASQNSS